MKKAMNLYAFSAFNKRLPIIDLAPYLHGSDDCQSTASLIRKACKQFGFFYIVNHGVPQHLQQSIFQSMNDFFALPLHEKKLIDIGKSGVSWRGYFEHGFEYTSSQPDQKEGIWYGREMNENHVGVKSGLPLHGSNPFPKGMPMFKQNVLEWLSQMERVGGVLSMAIADSLGLNRSLFIDGICKDHLGTLGMMHYPPQQNLSQINWGVSQHTDYGFLTLLMFDSPRLQVQDVDGKWMEIEPIPGTFVVNIGDILEVLTRGLYKSTPHRAINSAKMSRYSLPYFYDVNWHTKIQPLQIELSAEEQQIVNRVKAYSRWDKASLHETHGIFGHYYCRKLMKAFPSSLQEELKTLLNQ